MTCRRHAHAELTRPGSTPTPAHTHSHGRSLAGRGAPHLLSGCRIHELGVHKVTEERQHRHTLVAYKIIVLHRARTHTASSFEERGDEWGRVMRGAPTATSPPHTAHSSTCFVHSSVSSVRSHSCRASNKGLPPLQPSGYRQSLSHLNPPRPHRVVDKVHGEVRVEARHVLPVLAHKALDHALSVGVPTLHSPHTRTARCQPAPNVRWSGVECMSASWPCPQPTRIRTFVQPCHTSCCVPP